MDLHLSQYSYIGGYMPSKSDIELSKSLQNDNKAVEYCYIKRWLNHMRSFTDSETHLFPTIPPNILKMENIKTLSDEVCFYQFC